MFKESTSGSWLLRKVTFQPPFRQCSRNRPHEAGFSEKLLSSHLFAEVQGITSGSWIFRKVTFQPPFRKFFSGNQAKEADFQKGVFLVTVSPMFKESGLFPYLWLTVLVRPNRRHLFVYASEQIFFSVEIGPLFFVTLENLAE
jgi:hypothetical protein